MTRTRIGGVATAGALAVLLAIAAPAAGAPLVLAFEGTLDTVEDLDGVLGGAVDVGDRFSGRIRFDPAGGVNYRPTPNWLSIYSEFPEPAEIRVEIGESGDPLTLGDLAVEVQNHEPSDLPPPAGPVGDRLYLRAGTLGTPEIDIGLVDTSRAVLDSSLLPAAPLSLSEWSRGRLLLFDTIAIPRDRLDVRGSLDRLEVIPEPASALLTAGGLAAFGALRRSRRAAARARGSLRRAGP